eukprot:GHVT01076606.1.p1 GENE.GHVT01076606.1~~GHVT01076606.1.p1  ORF type:complete len:252 (+),score=60.86 GHVT01076606.1:424-1179(+)
MVARATVRRCPLKEFRGLKLPPSTRWVVAAMLRLCPAGTFRTQPPGRTAMDLPGQGEGKGAGGSPMFAGALAVGVGMAGAALLFPLYRRYCRDWAPCMSCCSSASSPPPCLSSSSPSSTQGTEGFLRRDRQPVALVSRKAISHDVFLLTFALPATDLPLGLPVGRHIRLFAKNDNFGKDTWNGRPDGESQMEEISRRYTPVSPPSRVGSFDLLVKVYRAGHPPEFENGGKMTQALEKLKVGETVDVFGPVG